MKQQQHARHLSNTQSGKAPKRNAKRIVCAVCIAIAAVILCAFILVPKGSGTSSYSAAATTRTQTVSAAVEASKGTAPSLSEAQAAIVTDSEGNVLWEENADAEMPMASITKIMTAMVVLDNVEDLDESVTCSDISLEEGAQAAGYAAGDVTTVRELLRVMLVYSANDAAEELAANALGGRDAFISAMNEKAQELGMAHTHFMNPSGLEADGHYSSASDLAIMGRYALENYPFIAQTIRLSSVTTAIGGAQKTFKSTDTLLQTTKGMLGIKTGAVESGTAFLGAYEQDGTRIYTCVLGCTTEDGRFADTKALISWAFSDAYETLPLAQAGTKVRELSFADHFGWVLDVEPLESVTGYAERGGDDLVKTSVTSTQTTALPGTCWQSAIWTQGTRTVGEATYMAGLPHPRERSIDEILFPLEAGQAA
ncbi:MAG: D-alanyl-D-alanine carboxypeptidase family protein [Atopobiaceae bacterium]